MGKINETKSWFFKKIILTNYNQTHQCKKKKKKGFTSIKSSINQGVPTNTTEMQRNIRDYYEQIKANKMDNLEEMDKFLRMYNLPKLDQEEIKSINRPIITNEIQSVMIIIKNSRQTKV